MQYVLFQDSIWYILDGSEKDPWIMGITKRIIEVVSSLLAPLISTGELDSKKIKYHDKQHLKKLSANGLIVITINSGYNFISFLKVRSLIKCKSFNILFLQKFKQPSEFRSNISQAYLTLYSIEMLLLGIWSTKSFIYYTHMTICYKNINKSLLV